jgi:hypothetical protein
MGRDRLGRTILRVYQHKDMIRDQIILGSVNTILRAGQAMDFAARLRDYGLHLSPAMAVEYAQLVGIGLADLRLAILPPLKDAGVLDYSLRDGQLTSIQEYVGVSASVLEQLVAVFEQFGPTPIERCLLHTVELAAWAPLTMRQHYDYLIAQGYGEDLVRQAVNLSLSIGVNRRAPAPRLGDEIIYGPYVWGTSVVDIAAFLRSLPTNERDVLLNLCETASLRPGLALPQMQSFNQDVILSARKVGLLQAATVVSTTGAGARQTYIFSPLQECEDQQRRTTEALHERKLFIAHILFGHEKAQLTGGRIRDPRILVNALLQRGQVGPAPNIGRDYHLLEASGIVRVEQTSAGPLMVMVKQEIVADSLALLERTLGPTEPAALRTDAVPLLRAPSQFVSPERDRLSIGENAATMEVMNATIQRLREEAQRAARHENPFD